MISSDIRKEVADKVEETLNKFRAKGHNIPTPPIQYRQMGRRAGLCTINYLTKSCTLTLNPDFFSNHHDEMINQTVPHEVVHYVSGYIYGREGHGHGFYWKMLMRQIGLRPSRCHTYSLEGVKTRQVSKPFKYICGCSDPHMVTLNLHTKMQEHGRTYTCRRCRRKLVYHRQVNNPPVRPVTTFTIGKTVVFQVTNPDPFMVVTPPPAPVVPPTPKVEEPKYKLVTRFENGMLVNVRIPVEA